MIENKVRKVAFVTAQAGVEIAEELATHQVASVFVDLGLCKPYTSNIRWQYSRGARQTVDYLYQLGHRDIEFIAGPEMQRSANLYREALEEALMKRDYPGV